VTRDLIVSGPADDDIDEYLDYLNERNPAAARRFLQAFRQGCDRLLSFPELGHLWETTREDLKVLRAWRVDDFPVSIFYFPRTTAIEVIRVLHHAKDIKAILEKL
jgi:plasmid stabilization system protein ParE